MKLEYMSGLEIGKLVNSQTLTAVEVLEYFQERIKRINPALNAIVYTRFGEARKRAEEIDHTIQTSKYAGPLAGVPVALKEFLPSKKGWTHSFGGVGPLICVDEYDSEFCKAVERLGAVVIGKTNAPPFGFSGCCDNLLYGPTHNPFNYAHNSGGSSGGSAAAVAAGLVPIAEGGDAGGSIRIPSAWCNCYGFKPGKGIVPNYCRPDGWAATHPFCAGGPITRSVQDAEVILREMAKYNPRDPYSVPQADRMFWNETTFRAGYVPSVRGKRIALTKDFGIFETDPEIVKQVERAADLLRSSGATVDEVSFNFGYHLNEYADMWCKMISVDTSLELEDWRGQGMDFYEDPTFRRWVTTEFLYWNKKAYNMNAADYLEFNKIRTDILDAFADVFENYDLVLAPVTACLPLEQRDELTLGPETEDMSGAIHFGETFLVNFIGYPAASIPMGFSESGLPIGIQLIGDLYHDDCVLEVSKVFEKENPWTYERAICNKQ